MPKVLQGRCAAAGPHSATGFGYSAWGKASAPGLRGAAVCPRAAPMGTVGQGAAKSCVLGRKELRAAATHAGMVQGAPWEIVNL